MILEVKDIYTSYGLSQVLFGLSLQLDRGEVVSLLGRNGFAAQICRHSGKPESAISCDFLTEPVLTIACFTLECSVSRVRLKSLTP